MMGLVLGKMLTAIMTVMTVMMTEAIEGGNYEEEGVIRIMVVLTEVVVAVVTVMLLVMMV